MTHPDGSMRVGAQRTDPWTARLAFHILQKHGPAWITLWLALVVGGLVALAYVAGPWAPGAITAVSGLAAGATAIAKVRIGRPARTRPDPALDPPP
jgi:hypothetical protein